MRAIRANWRTWTFYLGLAGIALLALPFVLYALDFAWRGMTRDLGDETYLFSPGRPVVNAAIFAHMAAGAVLTALVPLQLVGPLRRRWPAVHRWTGRMLLTFAVLTALGGLAYIAARGTIGGRIMDLGFTLYGTLLLVAAVATWRHARRRDIARHRDWALRTFVLAIGSWLYRFHYGLWYLATDGLWSAPDFSGGFDKVQVFAFYLPYLLVLELWLRRRPPAAGRSARGAPG